MGRRLKRISRLVGVSTVGTILVVLGVVMLFTPGPGLLAIIAGLAVLATEFRWAARLRDRAMERVSDLGDRARLERLGITTGDTDTADDTGTSGQTATDGESAIDGGN